MSSHVISVPAEKALEWLKEGNKDYLNAEKNTHGDISLEKRMHTHHHGQNPFACVITCSDSRVIPESIFMKGIGDLFVIRLAGNVLDNFGLGSVEYAVEHLGIKLILVMGHTACGAIGASLEGSHSSYIGTITNEIKSVIGETKSPALATKLNVRAQVQKIEGSVLMEHHRTDGVVVKGAVYHTVSGAVEILNQE